MSRRPRLLRTAQCVADFGTGEILGGPYTDLAGARRAFRRILARVRRTDQHTPISLERCILIDARPPRWVSLTEYGRMAP